MTCGFSGGQGGVELPTFRFSVGVSGIDAKGQRSAVCCRLWVSTRLRISTSGNAKRSMLSGCQEGGARRTRAAVSHCCWSRCITCAGSHSSTWPRTVTGQDCGSHRSRILNSLTPEGVMVSAHGPAPNFVACRSSRVLCCLNMAAKSAGEWSCFPPIHAEQRPWPSSRLCSKSTPGPESSARRAASRRSPAAPVEKAVVDAGSFVTASRKPPMRG
jgi:hypothetical protein